MKQKQVSLSQGVAAKHGAEGGIVGRSIIEYRHYTNRPGSIADNMWEFEHSIQCQTGRGFAWRFWTNVDNWAVVDQSVEWVKLGGPFAAGTKGITKPRGLDPVEWELIEVQDGRSALIEIAVADAALRFHWVFEESADGGTLITQRAALLGEKADDYAGEMTGLEKGMPEGMRKLVEAMVSAANSGA